MLLLVGTGQSYVVKSVTNKNIINVEVMLEESLYVN